MWIKKKKQGTHFVMNNKFSPVTIFCYYNEDLETFTFFIIKESCHEWQ
jgi:hypothetical protein